MPLGFQGRESHYYIKAEEEPVNLATRNRYRGLESQNE